MAAGTDAEVHGLGKRIVAGVFEHAVAECRIRSFSLLLGTASPVGDVMQQAATAPLRPVRYRAVREKAAAVARKVRQVRSVRRRAGGEPDKNKRSCQDEKFMDRPSRSSRKRRGHGAVTPAFGRRS
jgi:hypothetical protein